MRHHLTTSTAASARLDRLARRLEQAERAYRERPTRRNLDRQVACYHAWYWLKKSEAGYTR